MPSLQDVKTKISGVGKTKQITKAMNMVASAKLRAAQARIEKFRPYAVGFQTLLQDLASKTEGEHPLLKTHLNVKNTLILLITSDRGLCGGFNSSISSEAIKIAKETAKTGKNVHFICIGKKGRDAVLQNGLTLDKAYVDVLSAFDINLVSEIAKTIIDDYSEEKIDEVVIVYGKFESLSRQISSVMHLLPAKPQEADSFENKFLNGSQYLYEPNASVILNAILPQFINAQVFRALLDTAASENAARMMAMDNATRNCDELTKSLTLLYNKTRQASITNELIDIVGGAEALQ